MKKFNKDKYLKKLKFKKYKRYLYIGIPCLLVLLIGIYFAYSKFSIFKEEEVVRTTVGDFISGDAVIGAYIDGEYSKTIPGKNDGYIVDKIVCDNNASASWDNDSWGIVLTNLTKRTKCNVYFKIDPIKKIIAQLDTSGKCPSVNEDGSVNVTVGEATDGYLCKAKDAYGDSYYYRGNVTNNYVKFADKYWRIVRINGDGTVRVIYDGTSAHANGENSSDRIIGASGFNNRDTDNAYVGYMYGNRDAVVEATEYSSSPSFKNSRTYYIAKEYNYDAATDSFTLKDPIAVLGSAMTSDYIGYYTFDSTSATTTNRYVYKIFGVTASYSSVSVNLGYVRYGTSSKEVAQTNTNNSAIKTYLDNWYKTNIVGTTNEQYLADNVFCNDRSISSNKPSSSYNNLGYGINVTAYRWYYGPWSSDGYNSSMRLICPQKNDAFTVSDTTNGNGALTYPIGLLSTDEIVLAGGWNPSNSGYYLYSGQNWWASSPTLFSGSYTRVRRVNSNGNAFDSGFVGDSQGVRPVFNLKAEVLAQGSGTAEDPFHLSLTS